MTTPSPLVGKLVKIANTMAFKTVAMIIFMLVCPKCATSLLDAGLADRATALKLACQQHRNTLATTTHIRNNLLMIPPIMSGQRPMST